MADSTNTPTVASQRVYTILAEKYYEEGDHEDTPVIDLLSDLRHYTETHGIEFEWVVDASHAHWDEER